MTKLSVGQWRAFPPPAVVATLGRWPAARRPPPALGRPPGGRRRRSPGSPATSSPPRSPDAPRSGSMSRPAWPGQRAGPASTDSQSSRGRSPQPGIPPPRRPPPPGRAPVRNGLTADSRRSPTAGNTITRWPRRIAVAICSTSPGRPLSRLGSTKIAPDRRAREPISGHSATSAFATGSTGAAALSTSTSSQDMSLATTSDAPDRGPVRCASRTPSARSSSRDARCSAHAPCRPRRWPGARLASTIHRAPSTIAPTTSSSLGITAGASWCRTTPS